MLWAEIDREITLPSFVHGAVWPLRVKRPDSALVPAGTAGNMALRAVSQPYSSRSSQLAFRSSAVRPGRTVSSISFSRNAASYFPRRLMQALTQGTRPRGCDTQHQRLGVGPAMAFRMR